MRLGRLGRRLALGTPIVLVVGMFVAGLAALWWAGASVVARERRRSEVKAMLEHAGDSLAGLGRGIIARVAAFPRYADEPSLEAVERGLRSETDASVRPYPGVAGGYFVLRYGRFLGTVAGEAHPGRPGDGGDGGQSRSIDANRGEAGLPPLEAVQIDIQVDAAIRRRQVLFSVVELEGDQPATVAIRTAPMYDGERVVGACWVMSRLLDPVFADPSVRGHRVATGLALGGLVLSVVLSLGLALTVRGQAAERGRLEAELRRNDRLAALGKLLAGVAHEVRNPLAGIRSTAQLWQRGTIGLDEESLSGLVHEVDRLEEIVSRLLQFSRADAQSLTPGDLNAVVSDAARLSAPAVEAKGIRLDVALDPALPAVAMAPSALLQVLRNLTTNAIQAMGSGGSLHLATCHDAARRSVIAVVSDSGPGLSSEALGHLFEPFFTTKPEGTGLGLAIAREIALAHRGELRAANRGDAPGAVFTLTLPAADPTSEGPRS